MGFKDLKIFKNALLGKQAWRLAHKENTILGRFMKQNIILLALFLRQLWVILVVTRGRVYGALKHFRKKELHREYAMEQNKHLDGPLVGEQDAIL